MSDDRTVSFSQMKDGTKDDYLLLRELEQPFAGMTADRVLEELRRQNEAELEGYKISRYGHSLQSGTRAYRDGADIDWVVGALLHDIGDGLAYRNHDKMAAEIIRPYVREEVTWVVGHHGIFQMVYYAEHYGWDKDAREQYRDHPCFDVCAEFCERWDQASFDPDYENEALEFFEPMVREVFSRQPFDPQFIRPGVVVGLPPAE
jgi:predicted HD phosphohydrolase